MPLRRRDGVVGIHEGQHVAGIAERHRDAAIRREIRQFGIEADIVRAHAVAMIELAIDHDPRRRENRSDRKAFTPAGMDDNDFGVEPLGLEREQRLENPLGAMRLNVEGPREDVGA